MANYSHVKLLGGVGLTLSAEHGLRFTRKPNSFNKCIAGKMRGESYSDRKSVRQAFASAAKAC